MDRKKMKTAFGATICFTFGGKFDVGWVLSFFAEDRKEAERIK